jgi:hypothetical protein
MFENRAIFLQQRQKIKKLQIEISSTVTYLWAFSTWRCIMP